jgi:hypothetical protein
MQLKLDFNKREKNENSPPKEFKEYMEWFNKLKDKNIWKRERYGEADAPSVKKRNEKSQEETR